MSLMSLWKLPHTMLDILTVSVLDTWQVQFTLIRFITCPNGHITFGDSEGGKTFSYDTLNANGLLSSKNVLLVYGLKANIINVNQFFMMNFK